MRITLTPKFRKYVERMVKSGAYASPDELIGEAIDLMRERETKAIRSAIDESREQLRQGKWIPLSEMTVERVRRQAIKRFGLPRKLL